MTPHQFNLFLEIQDIIGPAHLWPHRVLHYFLHGAPQGVGFARGQLVYCQQEPLYCGKQGCNSPYCTRNAIRDLVVERADQVVNWLISQRPLEWTEHCLFHDYLGVTHIFYQIRHRYQQRMRGGCRPRRNFINVLVLHPYHNAFWFCHTTYKKAPCTEAGMQPVLTRIFNEAAELCTEKALTENGFYCKCDTKTVSAVPKDYMNTNLRPRTYTYCMNNELYNNEASQIQFGASSL